MGHCRRISRTSVISYRDDIWRDSPHATFRQAHEADQFITRHGLTRSYTVFSQGKTNGKSPHEPFSGAGDIDGDGITNADEYAAVVSGGGSIDTFAQVALYWPGSGPLPVAGIIGLGALASVIALAGAHRAQHRARRCCLFRARPLR